MATDSAEPAKRTGLFDLSVIDLSNGVVVAQVRYDYKIYM
jgi:hypothetical protein